MIGKHVDLVAIGVLLCGIGVYSSARQAMVLRVVPYKRIMISESVQRMLRSNCPFRSVRVGRITPSFAVVPHTPPSPPPILDTP